MPVIDDATVQPALRSALDAVQVHFEEAVDYARHNGLLAEVTRQGGELALRLKRPSDGAPCHYRIVALPGGAQVLHEKCYGAETERLEAAPDSVNQTVVETELASFFIRSAALPLDYIAQRHQPGFI